ncbi:DUF58 domain-containing protein [Larkinella soli]|uniref:DUF58 domain-containing protein n=1 Tax=Larkinella soli TaxID=1770527 RepID=UPI000FFC4A20|nr:DUF58 domain-containing protein [Larkinella soli]
MRFFRSLYVSTRVWMALTGFILLFITAYLVPALFAPVKLALAVLAAVLVLEAVLLFRGRSSVFARREVPDRLSNGDDNPLTIYLESRYPFRVHLEVIDEIPVQFQKRDVLFQAALNPNETTAIRYELRPIRRGEYGFGALNIYVMTPLRLLKRRFQFSQDKQVAVYPSFLQMRQYELLAITNRLTELGIKKVRRIGHSMEFEQVRAYTRGDDVRTINWKATARRSDLMVNAFQEEKSQAVYCLIDKGRVMKSPFEGLSLLDYAINASLVLSNIALLKQDRAGLMTFSEKIGQTVVAERRPGHMQKILEVLYRQKTRFLESDYEALYTSVRTHIRQRSLLLLFSNFETVNALHRQLPYLRRLAKDHLLIVVFFENTELRSLLDGPADSTEAIYQKTIAEKFYYEKKLIVKELQQYGIQTILTAPQHLTADTVNKYLELKARGMI